MSTLDFTFSDNSTQQLTLPTVDGIQSVPIVRAGVSQNVPFERFILADESSVFIFVLTAFISSGILSNQNPTKFRMGYGVSKDAMITPSGYGHGDVWKFQYDIRINNDKSTYSVIELISGELPPGLAVDPSPTSQDRVELSGKVQPHAITSTWETDRITGKKEYQETGFDDVKLEFLDVTYVESAHHTPTIISNPSKTFSVGDILKSSTGESRRVVDVSTYDGNKTKVVVKYLEKTTRNGIVNQEPFNVKRNEVIENGLLTNKKNSDFREFIFGSNFVAYYKDVNTVVETTTRLQNQHQKDYTFTLGMRSSEGTTYFAQQEFTIRVLQNHDNVRDDFVRVNQLPSVDVYFDPTMQVYVVDYLLPLTLGNGTVTSIKVEDGMLIFDDTNIEAYGSLTFFKNDDGVRKQSDITLGT